MSDINNQDGAQKFESATKYQATVTKESFDVLEARVAKLDKDLSDAKTGFEKNKFDLIMVLGIFVALVTYLGLEIQVFKAIESPLLIIGVSVFFIASILLFILTLNVVLKKQGPVAWSDFKTPLYMILIILFLASIIFITMYTVINYFSHKNLSNKVLIIYEN